MNQKLPSVSKDATARQDKTKYSGHSIANVNKIVI